MLEIELRGFSRDVKTYAADRGVLGHFDCRIGPVELIGCALMHHPSRGLRVAPPQLGAGRRDFLVRFLGDDIQRALTAEAVAAYQALGGKLPG